MKVVNPKIIALLVLLLLAACPQGSSSPSKKKKEPARKQIMVYAQRVRNEIQYTIHGEVFTNAELDYLLGEAHIDASRDSEIAVVMEDSMALSDVKEVPTMAMKAGFTDIRVFVYWKGTGSMAEVLFGPVMKIKKSSFNK